VRQNPLPNIAFLNYNTNILLFVIPAQAGIQHGGRLNAESSQLFTINEKTNKQEMKLIYHKTNKNEWETMKLNKKIEWHTVEAKFQKRIIEY
jgi:hypothetical protein